MSTHTLFDFQFFWNSLTQPSGPFLSGLWRTIYISIVAQTLAIALGLVLALMRRSRFKVLAALSGFYIWLMRGTPLLVQLVLVYDGLAALGIYSFPDTRFAGITFHGVVVASIFTLAINEAAYMAEIIRAGIDSVPRGQLEAATAGGMTGSAALRWIILPQAVRFMVPPIGNQFNIMMKTTAILSVIGVQEMFLNAQQISSTTFRTFEIFLAAAMYYLALTTAWSVIQTKIETRLNTGIGLPRPPTVKERLFGGVVAKRMSSASEPQTESTQQSTNRDKVV